MSFTIDARTYTSPNHSARTAPVSAICVHSCEGRPPGNEQASSIPWLCKPSSGVSSHFYITRAGTPIYQLVPTDREAWHAGVSALGGEANVNAFSVGIELEHRKGSPAYPAVQIEALTWLCRHLMAQYPAITEARVVSHASVALPKGRKQDPTDWSAESFRAWARTLQPRISHGLVLTNAPMARLKQSIASAHYTALKVVTAWGLGRPWTDWERREVLGLVPSVLVRTHAGDPSSGRPFPHWEEVVRELQPWVLAGATLVEIGNEPDASAVIAPAGYAWHLSRAREAIQRAWPHVKVCSPGLLGELRGASWIADPDFAAAVRACDFVGCHLYEHTTFSGPGHTNKWDEMERLYARFGKQPRMITEYGINDKPDGTKYARFVRGLRPPYVGAFAYHLDVSEGADYQLGAAEEVEYGQAF
jgi:N-acetyl-anhydromuramyl-L-alanine amidase AmpD